MPTKIYNCAFVCSETVMHAVLLLLAYSPFSDKFGLPFHNIPSPFLPVISITSSDISTLCNQVLLDIPTGLLSPILVSIHLLHPYLVTLPHQMSIPSQPTTYNDSCNRLNSNQPSQFFIHPSNHLHLCSFKL